MKLYRIGNYFHRHKVPIVPRICDALIRLVHNCVVYSRTDIGGGTIFGYGGVAVVIHHRARIGTDCVIGPHVKIGGRSKSKGVPSIGSGVYLGTGSKILGDIVIGDNSIVGANAVVICDIPAGSAVAGIPARIIRKGISARDFF